MWKCIGFYAITTALGLLVAHIIDACMRAHRNRMHDEGNIDYILEELKTRNELGFDWHKRQTHNRNPKAQERGDDVDNLIARARRSIALNQGLPYWIVPVEKLIHHPRVRLWCKLPYPNHPRGCPMFDKRDICPSQAPYVTDVFDIERPMWFVFSEFRLDAHVAAMRKKHPKWTGRQLRNCLYWQSKSRKQALARAEMAMRLLRAEIYSTIPEALGINVYRTCYLSGFKLEPIKKLKTCHHIIFIGFRKE